MEECLHICQQFSSTFYDAFPQFHIEDYRMTAIGWNGRVLNIDPDPYTCVEVKQLIEINKKKCIKTDGAISLTITQRRRTNQPLVNGRALTATNVVCCECQGKITGISFRCSQCEDYNLCCLCVTSGKHPQHLVNRATDSNVLNCDATTMSTSGTSDPGSAAMLKKLKAKIVEQDSKIKELDAENKRLVSARSEAVALLSQPCDRISSPEKKKRKSGVCQGPVPKNIRVGV